MFQSVNTRNALFAPLAASASLFGTYFLLKNNFDIATVYQASPCLHGLLACVRACPPLCLPQLIPSHHHHHPHHHICFFKPQLMTTAFGWYCLRDVLISLLLALSPNKGVPAFIDEYATGGVRAPEEGELNGVKLAASGACFTFVFVFLFWYFFFGGTDAAGRSMIFVRVPAFH